MCFSATASFTAAALLGAIQIAMLRLPLRKSCLFLALIPGLFGLQQLIEGFVWLYLGDPNAYPLLKFTPYAYLFFAILFWPIWIPFSAWSAEEVPWRRRVLFWTLIISFVLVTYYISVIPSTIISVNAVGNSLQYFEPARKSVYIYPSIILYPIIVVTAALLSSIKNLWFFGFTTGGTYLFAQYFFYYTFVSVWCFFGAIFSGILYFVLRDYSRSHKVKKIL